MPISELEWEKEKRLFIATGHLSLTTLPLPLCRQKIGTISKAKVENVETVIAFNKMELLLGLTKPVLNLLVVLVLVA